MSECDKKKQHLPNTSTERSRPLKQNKSVAATIYSSAKKQFTPIHTARLYFRRPFAKTLTNCPIADARALMARRSLQSTIKHPPGEAIYIETTRNKKTSGIRWMRARRFAIRRKEIYVAGIRDKISVSPRVDPTSLLP